MISCIIGGNCHYLRLICRDKITFGEITLLSRQIFLATNTCFLATKDIFHATKVIMFVARQNFCRDKNMFVATKVLSRQAHFCRDKRRVFSRQKTCFLATKMMAAPANDIPAPVLCVQCWLKARKGRQAICSPWIDAGHGSPKNHARLCNPIGYRTSPFQPSRLIRKSTLADDLFLLFLNEEGIEGG